jgi:hypothetical protein
MKTKRLTETQELDALIATYEHFIRTGREINGQPIRPLRLSALRVDLARLKQARTLATNGRRNNARLKAS